MAFNNQRAIPMAGPRPIQAPFGTPEYYQERAQILAGMTGDPVSAFNGSTAPNTTPAFSQTDPAGWRGRVMATTGQDPVAPGTAWAAPRMPQANPQAMRQQQFAQALMQQQVPSGQPQAYASQQRSAWQQQNPSSGGAFTGWQPQQANYAAKMQSLGGPAGGSIFGQQPRSGFSAPQRAVSQGAFQNRLRGLF